MRIPPPPKKSSTAQNDFKRPDSRSSFLTIWNASLHWYLDLFLLGWPYVYICFMFYEWLNFKRVTHIFAASNWSTKRSRFEVCAVSIFYCITANSNWSWPLAYIQTNCITETEKWSLEKYYVSQQWDDTTAYGPVESTVHVPLQRTVTPDHYRHTVQ